MLLNNGDTHTPDDADIIAWQKAYPAIDVYQELNAMESWLDANPTKRKTPRGIKRFVNSWLARAQDKGGSLQVKAKTTSSKNMNIEDKLVTLAGYNTKGKLKAKEFYLKN